MSRLEGLPWTSRGAQAGVHVSFYPGTPPRRRGGGRRVSPGHGTPRPLLQAPGRWDAGHRRALRAVSRDGGKEAVGTDVEIKVLSPLLSARHFCVTSEPYQGPDRLDPEAWSPGAAMLLCPLSPGILRAESPAVTQATLLPKQESAPRLPKASLSPGVPAPSPGHSRAGSLAAAPPPSGTTLKSSFPKPPPSSEPWEAALAGGSPHPGLRTPQHLHKGDRHPIPCKGEDGQHPTPWLHPAPSLSLSAGLEGSPSYCWGERVGEGRCSRGGGVSFPPPTHTTSTACGADCPHLHPKRAR